MTDVTDLMRARQTRTRVMRPLLILALIAMIGLIAWPNRQARNRALEKSCRDLVVWLKLQHLEAGLHEDVALPTSFAPLAQNGKATVVVLPNGELAICLKASIGFHQNWSGSIYVSSPIQETDLSHDYYGRPVVPIDGLPSHFVSEVVSKHLFHAGFDLN
ncbi:MAG: hypothetical protein NTW19_23700 [Planctomycetota bacterium]|nr:hypothetical protein [Planctomycetota bacterium]